MDVWFVAYCVLIVALLAAVLGKSRLQSRYPVVINGLTAVLVATCLAQWLIEGAGPWTLALGAVAVVLSGFAVLHAYRGARPPTRP